MLLKESEIHLPDCGYIIMNNMHVVKCEILKRAGGFVIVRMGTNGGIRLRESRVFKSEKEALACLKRGAKR